MLTAASSARPRTFSPGLRGMSRGPTESRQASPDPTRGRSSTASPQKAYPKPKTVRTKRGLRASSASAFRALGGEASEAGLGDEGLRPEAVVDGLLGDRLGPALEEQLEELEHLRIQGAPRPRQASSRVPESST